MAAGGYGEGWYRQDSWGGEYPRGFTMAKATEIAIRAEPDPAAAANIPCRLERGATYHMWNDARVKKDKLSFVSFMKTQRYRVEKTLKVDVEVRGTDKRATLALKPGDVWTYLAYGSEGFFLMRHDGKDYVAGQDLIEASKALDPDTADTYAEWLGLTCANGTSGWLLMKDIDGRDAFGSPHITDYGKAEDVKPGKAD